MKTSSNQMFKFKVRLFVYNSILNIEALEKWKQTISCIVNKHYYT